MIRIGHGYDLHRLAPGEGITLAGVKIPCHYRLVAHSDGDVVIHAICDALLGALALGDIGEHFPETDPQWKSADSREFLRHVIGMIHEKGYRVGNIDVTVIAQVPTLLPHKSNMVSVLATELHASRQDVNVKATTNEKLGHIGRKEGIAAHAVVCLLKL